MKQKKYILLFSFLLLFSSCSKTTVEDYQEEGLEIVRVLVHELHKIDNRQQLLESSLKLENLFNELVDLMIVAQEFQKHSPNQKETPYKTHLLSHRLRLELNRLYQIEGCRQLIEKYEEQALHRLDFYEKRKNSLPLKS